MRGNYSYGSCKKQMEMNEPMGQKLGKQYGQLKMLEDRDDMLRKKIQRVKYKVRGSNNGCIGLNNYSQRIQFIQDKNNNSQLQQSLRQKELQLQRVLTSSELIAFKDRNKMSEIGKITRIKRNINAIDPEQQTHQLFQLPSTPSSKLSYRRYFTSTAYLDSQQEQKQLRKIQQQVCRLKLKQKRSRELLKELTIKKMEESMAASSYSEGRSMSNLLDHDTTINHFSNTDITLTQNPDITLIQGSNKDIAGNSSDNRGISVNKLSNNNQEQVQTLRSIIKEFQQQILSLKQQNSILAQNISKTNDRSQQYKVKLQRQVGQLMGRIRQLESHNENLQQQLLISKQNYEQFLASHQTQVQSQRQQVVESTQSLQQSFKQQFQTLQKQIEYLQQQILQKNRVIDTKSVELEQKNGIIRSKEQGLKGNSIIIQSSMNIIQSLNAQIQQLSTQLSSSNNKVLTLSNKLSLLQIIEFQLRNKNNELEDKLKNCQLQLKSIQDSKRNLQYERDCIMVKNNNFMVENNSLMVKINYLSQLTGQLKAKSGQLTQSLNLKQSELISITEKLQKTQKQLTALEEQRDSKINHQSSQSYHKFPPQQSQLQLNSSQTISYHHQLSSHLQTLKSFGPDFIQMTEKFSILSQKTQQHLTLNSQKNLICQILGLIVALAKTVQQDRNKLNDEKNRVSDQKDRMYDQKRRFDQERSKVQQYINRQYLILNSQYQTSPSLSSPQSIKDEPHLNSNQNLPLTLVQPSPQLYTQHQIQFPKQINKHFSTSSISSVSKLDLNHEQQHEDSVNKSPQKIPPQHHKPSHRQNLFEENSSLEFITPKMEKYHDQSNHIQHSPGNQLFQYQTSHKSQNKKNLLFVQTLSDAASQSENQDVVDDFASSKSSIISVPNSRHNSKHKSFLEGYQPTKNDTHQQSDSNSMTKSAYSVLTNKQQHNKYQQNIRNTKLKLKLKTKKK